MKTAIAARGFLRSDLKLNVRRGERIEGAAGYIDDLARLGLVREVAAIDAAPEMICGHPMTAAGAQSSASPAAPVSPQTTRKRSGGGGRKKRGELSSS